MPEETRRYTRFPIENTVFIELVAPEFGSSEPGVIARCKTLDISRDGLRVTLEQQLQVGAILQLGVELPAPAEPLYLVGEVKWSHPLPGADPIGRQASRC
jgi:hypothetical protein